MKIQERRHSQIITLVIAEFIILLLFFEWISRPLNIKGNMATFIASLIVVIIVTLIIIYSLACETKTYYINENGIMVIWLLNITKYCYWSDFKELRIETVRYGHSYYYKYIICSKIPIRRSKIYAVDPVIDSDWLLIHPEKVIAIRIDDFKEGQLEEFWSYVPDRLK